MSTKSFKCDLSVGTRNNALHAPMSPSLLAVHKLVRDEVNALAREHEVGAESFALRGEAHGTVPLVFPLLRFSM